MGDHDRFQNLQLVLLNLIMSFQLNVESLGIYQSGKSLMIRAESPTALLKWSVRYLNVISI